MLKAFFKDISPKYCLIIILASTILALGLYNIHAQADITEGGILGLALLFEQIFDVSPAVTTTVMNVLCYLFGFRVLGRRFIIYSTVSTAGFSLAHAVFEQFSPFFPQIASYPLAAALLGAIFVGVGCGVCVRLGAAPSGDDALAMALSRMLRVRIAWVYLISDLTVLSLSLCYIPLRRILYSLLTVVLSGQIIGFFERVGNKNHAKL